MQLNKHMALAKRASYKSKSKWKIGAAIIKKNKLLASAHNINKTHPKFGSGDYHMLHAEGHAIWKAIRAGHDISGATMYVYRENQNLAKPCPCCMALIREHGIKEVIYTKG
ncbi:MAG TPA: hypothetical protein DCW74_11980 [Alteromonas australica]|uniref:CMP/dCMP-type deaminase domain-containing protein n=1 Tax=Alteromonas australica TaxID=589873 RepID=A0A350P571_9ALTE|nr:hypothetical protein [Alteromonas australica]